MNDDNELFHVSVRDWVLIAMALAAVVTFALWAVHRIGEYVL